MLSSSCSSPYVQRVLIPAPLPHTHQTYVSHKRGRFYASPLMSGNFRFTFSSSPLEVMSDSLWVIAEVTLFSPLRGVTVSAQSEHKGRNGDASGKTNKDSDSCQQHLSYLHFLIACELAKNHLSGSNRQLCTTMSL